MISREKWRKSHFRNWKIHHGWNLITRYTGGILIGPDGRIIQNGRNKLYACNIWNYQINTNQKWWIDGELTKHIKNSQHTSCGNNEGWSMHQSTEEKRDKWVTFLNNTVKSDLSDIAKEWPKHVGYANGRIIRNINPYMG